MNMHDSELICIQCTHLQQTFTTGLTSDMTTSVMPASNSHVQSVVLGVVGGVLAVGAILAVSVASAIIVVFMMKKRKRMPVDKGYYGYIMHAYYRVYTTLFHNLKIICKPLLHRF